MKARRVLNASEFHALIEKFLLKFEAENNLFLGILGSLARASSPAPDPNWYFVVESRERVIEGAGMITPPNRIILTSMPDEATQALARHALESGAPLCGAIGPATTTTCFSEAVRGSTRATPRVRHRQGVYAASRVVSPSEVSRGGILRPAHPAESDLIEQWGSEFIRETGIDASDSKKLAERLIRNQQVFVWVHEGTPRTMAAWSGPTPQGVRINLVYTPPPERGHGWASHAVAALTQKLFDEGKRFCFLFTDLANPTSNRIYQRIGYQAVSEFLVLDFDPETH